MDPKDDPDLNGWTGPRRRGVVLELLAGRQTLAGLAHLHHLSVGAILAWRDGLLDPGPGLDRRAS
jgi:hypothetical protein